MEFDKKVIVDIDGVIESGKQFDLDIKLPEDKRNMIYGIVRTNCGDPVEDAVVKLIEVNKDDRLPVAHAFTDKEGEFVFGPLCPYKTYAIQIWASKIKHVKYCAKCDKDYDCLHGEHLPCKHICDDDIDDKID